MNKTQVLTIRIPVELKTRLEKEGGPYFRARSESKHSGMGCESVALQRLISNDNIWHKTSVAEKNRLRFAFIVFIFL
jgi:hypothetical protein